MSYFTDCNTIEEIKQRYKDLAKQHHPDLGGDTKTMQDVNREYHDALKGNDKKQSDGFTYHYNMEVEQAIIDKISELLKALKDFDGINLWLVGRWVWIDGETKPAKEVLKEQQCRWASKHKRWYWRHESDRSRGKGGDFEQIANKYGMASIKEKPHGTKPASRQLNNRKQLAMAV